MKAKLKFLNGSWTDNDVDLLPTIKLRTSSKLYFNSINETLKVTSFALCWLKWGVMVSFGRASSKGKITRFIKRLLFGKPLYMSVYQDSDGNKYGGTIFKDKDASVIDHIGNLKDIEHVGVIEIY